MKLVFAFYLITGMINPMENEYKGYYNIYFEDNSIIEFATQEEVMNYLHTGEFVYFDDKGFNYRKHHRKQKRKKFKNRLFNSNNCRGVSYKA
jgi:hypothetical protein